MLRRKDKTVEETENKSRSGTSPLRFMLLRAVGGRRRWMVWGAPRVAPGDRTHERRVSFELRLHAARPAAHARGAERAPWIFRKGHDSPLLWMKLPPMVGNRRRLYKSRKLRKRGMTINGRFVYLGSVFQCGLWRLGRRLRSKNRRSDIVWSVSPRRRLRRSGRRPKTENF